MQENNYPFPLTKITLICLVLNNLSSVSVQLQESPKLFCFTVLTDKKNTNQMISDIKT